MWHEKISIGVAAIVSTVLIFQAILSQNAFAVSGPTGTQVNGWYVTSPIVEFEVNCSSVSFNTQLNVIEGTHSYEAFGSTGTQGSAVFQSIDGGASQKIGQCGTVTGIGAQIWTGVLRVDTKKPNLTVTFPSNNYNTSDSSITVKGAVSDDASNVSSVNVNGTSANFSNDTFSMNLPLVVGLNTIQVTAVDGAGHQISSTPITVLRQQKDASSPARSNGSAGNAGVEDLENEKSEAVAASRLNNGEMADLGGSNLDNNIAKSNIEPSPAPIAFVAMGGVAITIGAASVALATYKGKISYRKVASQVKRLFNLK